MYRIKNWVIPALVVVAMFTVSCDTNSKKKDTKKLTSVEKNITKTDSIGAELFNQKCMICHNHVGKVDSTMLAPPFFQVKDRYLRASMDKEDFIETMTNWVRNPSEENILMRGTMDHFEVMPYLGYSDTDISKIVNYIYQNDMEEPEWFEAHQEAHKREGRGMGNGKGRRQGGAYE